MISNIKNIINSITGPTTTAITLPPQVGSVTVTSTGGGYSIGPANGGGGGGGGGGFYITNPQLNMSTEPNYKSFHRGEISWLTCFPVEIENFNNSWAFHLRVWMQSDRSENIRFATTKSHDGRVFLVFDNPTDADSFRNWKSDYTSRYSERNRADNAMFPSLDDGTHTFTLVQVPHRKMDMIGTEKIWAWITDHCGPVFSVTPQQVTTSMILNQVGYFAFINLSDAVAFKLKWISDD